MLPRLACRGRGPIFPGCVARVSDVPRFSRSLGGAERESGFGALSPGAFRMSRAQRPTFAPPPPHPSRRRPAKVGANKGAHLPLPPSLSLRSSAFCICLYVQFPSGQGTPGPLVAELPGRLRQAGGAVVQEAGVATVPRPAPPATKAETQTNGTNERNGRSGRAWTVFSSRHSRHSRALRVPVSGIYRRS